MTHFLRRLRARIRHRHVDAELRQELDVHRAMAEDDLRAGGAAPDEARHLAARRMGNSARSRTRRVDRSLARERVAGRAICREKPAAQPRVHRDGSLDADARCGSEYDALLVCQYVPAPALACAGRPSARAGQCPQSSARHGPWLAARRRAARQRSRHGPRPRSVDSLLRRGCGHRRPHDRIPESGRDRSRRGRWDVRESPLVGVPELWMPLSSMPALFPDELFAKEFMWNAARCCVDMVGRLHPGLSRSNAEAELSALDRRRAPT